MNFRTILYRLGLVKTPISYKEMYVELLADAEAMLADIELLNKQVAELEAKLVPAVEEVKPKKTTRKRRTTKAKAAK